MQSKFKVTDWIKYQSIQPLKWGDSANELAMYFENAQLEIDNSIKTNTPYIVLDFVEFYFDDDRNFKGLNTIIIKCVSIYKGLKPSYFNEDWLGQNLSYIDTCKYLKEFNIEYTSEYEKGNMKTPIITTKTGQIFVFYDHSINPQCPLHKIYLQK